MGFVPQGFSPLLQDFYHATRQAAAQLPLRLFSNSGGLFASAADGPPPGAPSLDIAPHDHSDRCGGQPMPRGVIYSFNGGDQTGWVIGFGESSGYPNVGNTTSTWAAVALREYGFKAPVTPGIDSSKTNLQSDPCALEGWGIIYCQGDPSLAGKLRISNAETGTLSGEAALVEGFQEIYFTDIPCKGGIENRLTPEAWLDTDGEIFIFALSIAETRQRSQPVSAGTYVHSSLTTIV